MCLLVTLDGVCFYRGQCTVAGVCLGLCSLQVYELSEKVEWSQGKLLQDKNTFDV